MTRDDGSVYLMLGENAQQISGSATSEDISNYTYSVVNGKYLNTIAPTDNYVYTIYDNYGHLIVSADLSSDNATPSNDNNYSDKIESVKFSKIKSNLINFALSSEFGFLVYNKNENGDYYIPSTYATPFFNPSTNTNDGFTKITYDTHGIQTVYADGKENCYSMGFAFHKYFILDMMEGSLDKQPETVFIGYCHKNDLFTDFINFLITFFAWWRNDEGCTVMDPYNYADNFYVSGWAALVDTSKLFYFTSETVYWWHSFRVKYVLEQSQVVELPDLVKPEDFEKVNGLSEVYRGILKEYNTNNN